MLFGRVDINVYFCVNCSENCKKNLNFNCIVMIICIKMN